MAYSTLQLGTTAKVFHDLDAIALILLLGREAKDEEFSAIQPLILGWVRSLEAYGPGTIDLREADPAFIAAHVESIRALLARVDQALKSYGRAVPAKALQDLCPVGSIRFAEYSTELLSKALDDLRTLLIPTTPTS